MIIDSWHPVTSDLGLIHAQLDDVVGELLNWHKSIEIEYNQREVGTSLSDAFKALLPLSNAKQRRLFVKTSSGWTACFQNGIQGSDPFPAMSYLAKRMNVLSMRVCATPTNALWPALIWEVYAPEYLGGKPPLNYRRSIAVSNDGGRWVFEETGIPFDFERTELYEERRKKDRFPRELLVEYLGQFSLRPFEDQFYSIELGSPAVLLQQIKPTISMPEFSLEDVIAGKPWVKN